MNKFSSFCLYTTLTFLASCSAAKDIYVDSKYKMCRETCGMTYSKYESSKLGQCLNKCTTDKNLN